MELEILAPSGDYQSLLAALNAGADAIYLGLSNFNARAKAENFTKENIKETVRLIHLYGAKCYVTINTLVKDEEYKELISLLKCAVKAKVDAYIVQDLGVARVMKECFPSINIHASTQMGISNLNGALFAEAFGFSRIVLARETKLEDIKLIRQYTNLEIEYFCHGALCVSYSGNCYLSSFLHQMSGNRGKCLQLCRLEYNSSNSDKGYFLSAKDLCLINEMEELIDAGVTSFKIEGRMKHPGYVARTVSEYKKALEYAKKHKKYDTKNAILSLKESFVRGDYLYGAYLDKSTPDMAISKKNQNHMGVKIGKVISSSKFKDVFEIKIFSNRQIHKGDGLKFFVDGNEICSLGVGNVNIDKNTIKIYSKNKIANGADVHLILNAEKENEILSNKRKMHIRAKVIAIASSLLRVEFEYKGIKAYEESEMPLEKAHSNPTSKEDIVRQVDKMGEEPFIIDQIDVEENGVFIPKSIINDTRRKAIEKLKEAIIAENERDIYDFIDEERCEQVLDEEVKFDYSKKIIISDNVNLLSSLDRKDEYLIVFAPSIYNESTVQKGLDELKEKGFINLAIYQPLIMLSSEQKVLDNVLMENKGLVLYGNNVSCLNYALNGEKVIVSPSLNVFSKQSLKTYKEICVLNVVSSLEVNKEFLDKHKDIYAYMIGYNTLMNFVHCPYKTIHENKCNKCSFDDSLMYEGYSIRRCKQELCSFELINKRMINTFNVLLNKAVIDFRGLKKSEVEYINSRLNDNCDFIKLNENEYLGVLNKVVK